MGSAFLENPIRQVTRGKAVFLLIISIVFIATTAPSFWNKANLEVLLFRNGAYEWLCTSESPPVCEAQRVALSRTFTFAVASLKLSGMALGPLVDIGGPKITALVGQILFGLGLTLLSFNYIWAGFIAIGASMNPVFNSVISVANLFPHKRNFVMSLLSSGGDAAFLVFLSLLELHDFLQRSISVGTIFLGYLGVVAFHICAVLLFWPNRQWTAEHSPSYVGIPLTSTTISEDQKKEDFSVVHAATVSGDEKAPLLTEEEKLDKPSETTSELRSYERPTTAKYYSEMKISEQVKTPHFWAFLPLFCLFFFQKTLFNDALNDMLQDKPGATEERVIRYTKIFSLIQGFAFIPAWCFGFLADVIGVPLVLLVVHCLGITSTLLNLVPSLPAQLANFVVFAMFKSYTISSAYAFISDFYGFTHLGALTGMLQICAGVCVLGNIPLREWIVRHNRGDWKAANIVLLVVGCSLTVIPLYLHFSRPPSPPLSQEVVEAELEAERKRKKTRSILGSIVLLNARRNRCVSAGPMFCELQCPCCRRCLQFECCCRTNMYCLSCVREVPDSSVSSCYTAVECRKTYEDSYRSISVKTNGKRNTSV